MAAAHGYGGEFSSDEDIDRMEQQSEAFASNKFNPAQESAKPRKQKVEEIIQNIRQIPADQEITLSDDYLVALLDYYRIQRGPVVDSTRKLYQRIALKRIRDDEQQQPASNGQGGDTNNGLNGNSDNNNSINIISKRLQSAAQVEPTSSDDDEPMPPASSQSSVEQSQGRRKFDSRVAYINHDKPEPMEVDTAAPAALIGEIRTTKQVDISSSEDESDDEESKSGESSDSEELDITPLKNPSAQHVGSAVTAASAKIIASTPIKDSTPKLPPVTPKEATKSSKATTKTPQYTRSQRIATRSSSSTSTSKTATTKKASDVSSSKVDDNQPITQVKPLNKSTLASKFRVRSLISTLLVALLAIFIYYYRNDLTDFTRRILSKTTKIQF